MEQPFPPVRRNILLILLALALLLLPLLVLLSPLIVGFDPPAVRQSRLNYFLFTPLLIAVLVGLVYRYLAPVARLGRLLRQDKEPSPEMVRRARRVAFDAPAYLFITLPGLTVLTILLSNVTGLLFIPGYEFGPHLSEALLVTAISTSMALLVALIARRQMQAVLVTTSRFCSPAEAFHLPTDEGRRFDIRFRVLVVILALSFVAYYFPSILAFNLVYQADSEPLIRRTIFLLLGFGLVTMSFALLSALIVTGDVSDDLRQVTRRLLQVARRGVSLPLEGGQLPVLSLDEVGDLVRAFNEVQARIQAQQERLQQEHRRLLALQSISSRINTVFDLDRLLDELVQSVRATFGYYNALVFLVDEEEEELYLAASDRSLATEVKERRFKIGAGGGVGRVASDGTPLLVSDVSQHDFPAATSSDVRSAMVTPMLVGGRLVGVFGVESDQVRGFGEQDLQLVTALANQAAAAIEAVRLVQESRANAMTMERRAQNLMLINRISGTLTSLLDAYEILDVTVQHLVELSGVDYGGMLILERDGEYGQIIAEHPAYYFADLRLHFPRLVSLRQGLDMGIPYVVQDAANHPLLEPLQRQVPSLEFRSLLLVPLVARREMIGILLLASVGQHRDFTDEEIEICQTIASQAAVAVANARLLQDIQQQRRALARKSQEMTEESSKLDAIINNIADGLVVTDPTGRIILSNPVFREIVGLPSVRSLRGLLLAGAFPVAGLQSLVAQALEMPGQVFTENLELPDGRVLKTSSSTLRIPPPVLEPEKGEQIAGVVTVLRDITHEVEVDRMKTDFVSAVSHELRTPLTAVLGFASLIRRDFHRWILPRVDSEEKTYQVAERIVDNLVIVENESERLTRLINDLLDIAKMEAGEIEWPMSRADLADVIWDAIVATTTLAREKNLPVQVHLPPGGFPPVWGHRDRLVQVTTNLLSNAVKFTERGRIEVRGWSLDVQDGACHPRGLSPSLYRSPTAALADIQFSDGEWVVVSVADTGVGIPAENLPRVFEKFTQVGDTLTEKPEGTGLGLAISREIIEYHGGHIWAESEPGEGSVFSFALPAHRVAGKAVPVASSYSAESKVNREERTPSEEIASF